jgi:hypothetical protein
VCLSVTSSNVDVSVYCIYRKTVHY